MAALPLSRLAGDVGLSPTPFHEEVAGEILRLFKLAVLFTAILTVILVGIDTVEMWNGIIHPAERLVTEKVLLALIGATVVQVGATSAAIVYSLFKAKKADEGRVSRRSRATTAE